MFSIELYWSSSAGLTSSYSLVKELYLVSARAGPMRDVGKEQQRQRSIARGWEVRRSGFGFWSMGSEYR